MYETIEHFFKVFVNYSILFTELAGVAILIATVCKSFVDWVRKDPHVRLKLAQGIAIALDFKLGSEVLRTVVVQDWNELLILGTIIGLRGALTVLIHWQIVKEEQRLVE